MADLYDVAREVTDEVLGAGTYAEMNAGNPDPGVQAAIARAYERDRCACGGSPTWAPEEQQVHRADCEVRYD